MRKQFTPFASVALVLATSLVTMALPAQSATPSTFSIAKKTQIPGDALKPGTYSIQILDHLSDRMVVRVESPEGKQHTVFLAVPSSGKGITSSSGAVIWKSDVNGLAAMRGFAFPTGYTVEFVYPKAVAAELAKANTDRVIAIDPQSEGRPALHKMSPEDLQMVNLWLLSLTTVGPGDKTPAILAERYQARTTEQTFTASATPARELSSTPVVGTTEVAELAKPQVGFAQAARVPTPKRHPAIAALPHTGSSLPLIVLAGLFALATAAAIRLRTRQVQATENV